jgi:hypothetical protein
MSDSSDTLTLDHVTTVCGAGSCPTVYRTNRGTLVIQGYVVTGSDVGLNLPAGENLVEVPAALLTEAARTVQ